MTMFPLEPPCLDVRQSVAATAFHTTCMRPPPPTLHAMQLTAPGRPLQWTTTAMPVPRAGEVLVRVAACGVCRTDLHIVDGELPPRAHPVVPGHEIVGRVAALGAQVDGLQVGDRVGIPWLGWTCGSCDYCTSGRENLCAQAEFTGYQRPGGYADHVVADSRYCFPLAAGEDDVAAARLLCA